MSGSAAKSRFHRYWFLLKPGAQRDAFAKACGTTADYLNLVASGHSNASAKLALAIERESNHVVEVEDVCPDVDWSVIRHRPRAQVAA